MRCLSVGGWWLLVVVGGVSVVSRLHFNGDYLSIQIDVRTHHPPPTTYLPDHLSIQIDVRTTTHHLPPT